MVYEIKSREDGSIIGTTEHPKWVKLNKDTETWIETSESDAEGVAYDSVVHNIDDVVITDRDGGRYTREVELTEETNNVDTMLGLAELSVMIADLEARVEALEKK